MQCSQLLREVCSEVGVGEDWQARTKALSRVNGWPISCNADLSLSDIACY